MKEGSAARQQKARRMCDVLCASAGLVILAPVFAALGLLIRLRDGRPVLFSQTRVGRFGKTFRIWKFRTMRTGENGSAVTASGDRRVTSIGARLRKLKLDELPQLVNVLKGEMSLIGPRPELPEFVDKSSPIWQAVLQIRPGITDLATLLYRDEEVLLGGAKDVEKCYRERVLPEKLLINLRYLRTRSFRQDLKLVWLTLCSCLSPGRVDTHQVQKAFPLGAGYGR